MKIQDFYLNKLNPIISFEIFPPKTDKGLNNLKTTIRELIALSPDYITVTYGAMGSTRDKTIEIASFIRDEYDFETACHLTCVGATRDELNRTISTIYNLGINNIVALRGDPPSGKKEFTPQENGFKYGYQLVELIRNFEYEKKINQHFGIAVAGYPEKHLEALSFDADISNLKRKVNAGANLVITQLFYDNQHYYKFVEKVRDSGLDVPIVPGLMPILSTKQIKKIASMCGSQIPTELSVELEKAEDNDELAREIGTEQCIGQCKELLKSGVPGIHFYVLNKSQHMQKIIKSLPV